MRVVCDAGPLIHLARAGHFDLLQDLFGRVLIPPAVYLEAAISRMRQRGTWIADDLVAAILAASRRR
jgi:predicted nucleic acid-binding protein